MVFFFYVWRKTLGNLSSVLGRIWITSVVHVPEDELTLYKLFKFEWFNFYTFATAPHSPI